MSVLMPIVIVVLTVVVMEGIAYSVHRWIMHGPLGWGWHKSHHEETHGPFEKNDLYAVVFAVISILLFAVGGAWWPWLWWVAAGASVYGVIYFVVHDGLVHQRWPFRYVPRRGYFRRLYQAHRLHHAVEGRDDCVSFGFVYAPPVEDLKARLKASGVLAQRQSQHRDAWRADRPEE
ncbi:sterol desaturase family protein [Paracoccus benzoatiresistens]|uniref:Sterol desaturase family protein n=1 Tax=Paracoccus benzoatiresistens TaxID=2997341 RepID=A0ABT4J8E5_9RHOB|nr:sterol desaturase family protein [Paracoccus sp. EF6]MCZ0963373.1 sterol desaturase family protein [Paracoccus sp. EF6]